MTLPNLTHPLHRVDAGDHASVSLTVHPETQEVSLTVCNNAGARGITLSAWDADALAAHLHVAVTETLFDLPAVS